MYFLFARAGGAPRDYLHSASTGFAFGLCVGSEFSTFFF